jgi:uncharacterized RDD family membrane protein YckC
VTGPGAGQPDRLGQYAGFVTRFVAFVIDYFLSVGIFLLVLGAASFAASVLTGGPIHFSRQSPVVLAIYVVWVLFYFGYCWGVSGKTPGAAVLGVQVIGAEGGAAGPRRAFLRTIAFPFSFLLLGLGFLGILTGQHRRALHDVVGGTVVVYAWSARAARLRFLARNLASPAPGTGPGLPGRDAPQQLIDDPGGEAGLRGRDVVLAPGHNGAGQGQHGDLDVGVGSQLAGGDATAEH